MKRKSEIFFKTAAVSLMAGSIFFGLGFFYLNGVEEKEAQNNEVSSVPYYSATPETAGILLKIDKYKTFFQLDFEDEELTVIYADSTTNEDMIYGYEVDYTVTADLDLLSGVVDIFSGIDIEAEDETLNYTGVQIAELLGSKKSGDMRRVVTEKLIEKIAEFGFTNESLLYIIKNSETNLTVPDCYFWPEYICGIFSSVRYVN